MYSLKRKHHLKHRLYSPLSLLLLLVVVFFVSKATYFMYKRSSISNEKLEYVKKELEDAEERRNLVKDEVDYLGTPLGVEEEIRTKFNLVKEGEQVIVIVDEEGEDVSNTEPKGVFGKLFDKVKNLFGSEE